MWRLASTARNHHTAHCFKNVLAAESLRDSDLELAIAQIEALANFRRRPR